MKYLVLALAIASGLAGCTQVQMFAMGDLSNAAALAKGGDDPAGAACWQGLAPAAAASPAPASDGLAVLAERDRLLHAAVAGPCGAVVAPALLQLINKAQPLPLPF